VIVATSTLEIGIDVGDLDRVIQIAAPRTVASVLQRVGRTGRRPGTVRNCLFLATTDMELLHALALVALAHRGWVEPLVAPPEPVNLVAQQLLARVLAEGRVGRSDWPGALERVVSAAALERSLSAVVLDWMLGRELVVQDAGLVAIGPAGEREYGRRHFMDVTSLFLTEPLLAARWGARQLGSVDPSSLSSREDGRPTILLGGRAWGVRDIDWDRSVVWVEPVDEPGRSRWSGGGAALSIEVCHAMREVLADPSNVVGALSERATVKLAEIRSDHEWARDGRTTLVRDSQRNRVRWWTFGGARANQAIAADLDVAGVPTMSIDDLGIGMRASPPLARLMAAKSAIDAGSAGAPIDRRRLDAVKFASCLPDEAIERMLAARDRDADAVTTVLGEPVTSTSN
jgi:ATP-dependent Lhr-like helicase